MHILYKRYFSGMLFITIEWLSLFTTIALLIVVLFASSRLFWDKTKIASFEEISCRKNIPMLLE